MIEMGEGEGNDMGRGLEEELMGRHHRAERTARGRSEWAG